MESQRALFGIRFVLSFIAPLLQDIDRISSGSGDFCAFAAVCRLLRQVRDKLRALQTHRAFNLVATEILEEFQHTIAANQLKKFLGCGFYALDFDFLKIVLEI